MERDECEGEGAQDEYLEARLTRYEAWIRQGRIPYSSKVVPIQKAVEVMQWILPTEGVVGLLQRAHSIALVDCVCRVRYRRCDNPVEVCLRLDGAADSCVARGKGRYVSVKEAVDVMRKADERGLVHMTVYNPEQQVYAVCSCCTCCCHEFQYLLRYGRRDLVARSDYVARTNPDKCTGCGECLDRCPFHARTKIGNRVGEQPESCYGCGLCVPTCPGNAIELVPRHDDTPGEEASQQ